LEAISFPLILWIEHPLSSDSYNSDISRIDFNCSGTTSEVLDINIQAPGDITSLIQDYYGKVNFILI